MYEKLEQCPACKHTQFNNFLISQDLFNTQESFALVRCTKCQLVFTNPRVHPEHLSTYQYNPDIEDHSFLVKKTYRHLYHSLHKEQLKYIVEYSQPSTVLDISDFHLSYSRHWNAKGWSIKSQPFDIYNQENSILQVQALKEKFSNITCFNTFQNVYKIKTLLKTLRKMLNPNGFLYISLPNYQSLEAKDYQSTWPGYNVPRTQYHFNQQSFSMFVKANKLHLVDVIPLSTSRRYFHLLHQMATNQNISMLHLIEKTRQSNKLAKRTTAEASMNLYVLSV